MSNVILSLKNVTKRFGKRIAVRNLSLDIFQGEIFGFLGPNGAGKTTTIRMICGLAKIDSGDIFICGNSITKKFEKAIINVGGIIENPEMYLNMSGLSNLKYYAGLYKGITKQRIKEVVEIVGLTSRIKDKVRTYSLGMKQRLGIAQALLHHPKLLVLDEPTNGLDPEGIVSLRKFLKELVSKEEMAILVSSHNLSEMSLMCTTIGIINNGVLEEIKSIKELEEANTMQQLMIKVNFPNFAGKLIKQTFKIEKISIVKNTLNIQVEEELIPKITTLLVQNGVEIYSVSSVNRSLEDIFLSTINKKALPAPKGDEN